MMMLMPSFLRSSCISSRICAWMVTSSAVVGSSAISSLGSQARAMAIITRWRIPPDSSWGYCFRRFSGSLMPTSSSSSSARAQASCLFFFGVQADDLHDLVADGVHRVQAGHGVLEDDGDFVAADLAEVLLLHLLDLVAVEPHGAAHQLAGVGGQAHDRVSGNGLAGTGLAHDAQHVALVHRKGNAVQCLDLTGRGEEGKALFLDIKNFFAHLRSPHQFFSFGSKASRRPSPNRLNTRIITLIITAGAISRWG